MTAIMSDIARLREAATATGQLAEFDAWQAERNAMLAEHAEMERRWASEDAARRNRLAVATTVAVLCGIAAIVSMVILL